MKILISIPNAFSIETSLYGSKLDIFNNIKIFEIEDYKNFWKDIGIAFLLYYNMYPSAYYSKFNVTNSEKCLQVKINK